MLYANKVGLRRTEDLRTLRATHSRGKVELSLDVSNQPGLVFKHGALWYTDQFIEELFLPRLDVLAYR